MKLLVDMNLSPRWIEVLSNAGLDAMHWSSIGPANAPDFEIMTYARQQSAIVLTHDLDFSAILSATQGRKPSVVQVRTDDVSPEAIGSKVLGALHAMRSELEQGCLLTIDPKRTRVRLLPLPRQE
jgi:predicted nuclease of predicted toxin-antitoxin system